MTKFPILILALMLFLCVGASAQQVAPDLKGTWSGTFVSRNADISPFTITVKIKKDLSGHLIGDSNVVSDCLDSHRLQITVKDSNVELAGSDEKGDTVTFSGTVDNTGTVLTLHYIINGSPSGRCEIDDGNGTMGKR
jgi:type 1 fimbria pilin